MLKLLKKVGEFYRLKLPLAIKIHNVFHPDFLELVITNFLPGQKKNLPPGPIKINDQKKRFVDEILDSKHYRKNKKFQYRIKWNGLNENLTWYNIDGKKFENNQKANGHGKNSPNFYWN